ncbi:MAG: hypothetical protein FD170_3721 [Bacteroidetes bacterium]|nr:MAG: hypothetical protein FD170_3721 [Bacteroidota bacterium]
MKRIMKLIPVLVVSLLLTFMVQETSAQGPPPPPPDGHGATGNQPPTGGNAPIGSGMAILLVLGAAYAGKKAYDAQVFRD